MMNKKDNLIIFVLALLVISLAVFVMTKDIDLNKNKNQNNNKNIYVSQEQKDNRYELINKNRNVNKPPSIDYSGELTKEANGWKKYRNEYWGVEFKFQDKDDGIKVHGGQSGISLSNANVEFGSKDFPAIYIYINFFDYDEKEYNSLKECLDAGEWNNFEESAELISIKEITNNNGLTFVETIANVIGRTYLSEYYKVKCYYTEYYKMRNNKNYIYINGPLLNSSDQDIKWQDVIDTFKFID